MNPLDNVKNRNEDVLPWVNNSLILEQWGFSFLPGCSISLWFFWLANIPNTQFCRNIFLLKYLFRLSLRVSNSLKLLKSIICFVFRFTPNLTRFFYLFCPPILVQFQICAYNINRFFLIPEWISDTDNYITRKKLKLKLQIIEHK